MNKTTTAGEIGPVVIMTEYGEVFHGRAKDITGPHIYLEDVLQCVRYDMTRGWLELAESGPSPGSRIESRSSGLIHRMTAVAVCTDRAVIRWKQLGDGADGPCKILARGQRKDEP